MSDLKQTVPQFFPSVKWANSLLHRIVVEHLAHGLPHRKRLIYPSLTEHLLFGRAYICVSLSPQWPQEEDVFTYTPFAD